MKVATWNVNSIRTRLEQVTAWLDAHQPHVVCLQETKTVDEKFPREPFQERGYAVELYGQKTYNGVALLSKLPVGDVRRGLPGDEDDDSAQRRLISAGIGDLEVINVYVPNGSEVGSPKFAYKLDWLERLARHLRESHDPGRPLLLCGDFNIAPEDRDVHDPEEWRGQVLFHPDEHKALARLTGWGLADALRLHQEAAGIYTWWDYRAAAFRRDRGLRIDLILVTESLARRCRRVEVHRDERARERPSDHVPVVAILD